MSGTPQLPLPLRAESDQRFDTFVDTDKLLEPLREQAMRGREFILLSGPAGSGKTHLALAVVQAAMTAGRDARYVPLTRLQGRVAAALAGLEQYAVIALDDLDGVLGGHGDEVALFDFHNRARAAQCALLYTARETAAGLPVKLPDLASRLGQCTQLVLPRLDDELRGAILQRKARMRGLTLDEAVLGFLLRRVGRDMTSLVALLERIDQASLAEQRRVTVPFVRTLLESS